MGKVKSLSKNTVYPFWITLAGALLMAVMLFLPYATATENFENELMESPEQTYSMSTEMTNEEVVNLSLFDYLKIDCAGMDYAVTKAVAIANLVIILIFGAFVLLTILMSALKKPIATIVFDVLSIIAFTVIHFDFSDRGIISNGKYNWGIANYLTYALGAVVLAGAVWQFIEKRKAKKQTESI
ncbi:MAG: hypothetical protein SO152_00030 [Ruminococcus sp.]|nr:hypothetical protein [Ruminococcus sp.]